MKCKNCKREIENGSIFCNWCGHKQITVKSEMSIPKPKQLPSGSWFGQVMVKGKRVSITCDTEKEWNAKATALKAELIESTKACNVTVADCMDEYIQSRSNIISPSTMKSYKDVKKHRFLELQKKKASAVTLAMVQKAVNEEAKTIGYKTLKNALGVLLPSIREYSDISINDIALPQKQFDKQINEHFENLAK